MNKVVGLLFFTVIAMGQTKRDILDTNEVVNQLGLCNANLVLEQRFVKALQAENEELRKKLAAAEKPVEKK